jgi:SpoVK/Ycf46/Vps4 family AAA+-type ATPase
MTTENHFPTCDLPEAPPETKGWAKLANMELALRTMLAAEYAGPGAPRLALFYGPSGVGKTFAAAYVTAQTHAAYIMAQSVMTQRSFLEALAHELGIARPANTLSKLMAQIIDQLALSPCPIVIDEMDYLVKKQMVEIIRDIHDGANVPILMVGEEALPDKLKEWERFDNRIIAAQPAQTATIADGRLLRDVYCRHVKIADDLVDYFVGRCRGVTRRIVVNLQNAQTVATDELDTAALDLDLWGNRPVVDGNITPRRNLGFGA